MSIPRGKGMYIWQPDRLGTPEFVAQKAQEVGLDWVGMKFQDGIFVTDGSSLEDFEAFHPDRYVECLKARGIAVHGWGYVYGRTKYQVDGEIRATLAAIERFKPESWTIDAEREYYQEYTTPQLASRYVTNVRLGTAVSVGFSAYRYPSLHPNYNWDVMFRNCDFASPQVYWEQASNPGAQLKKCLAEYREKTSMPIIPIGSAYPAGSWRPTPAQVDEFYQTVIEEGLPGWSWWEWYYAWLDKGIWDALAAHKSNIEQPENPEIPPAPVNKRKWWLYRLIEHVMR